MHHEHYEQADNERDERRIECDAKTDGDADDITFNGAMGLTERLADTADRSDKPDRRDRPNNVSDHREFGVQSRRLCFAYFCHGTSDILDIPRRPEALQGGQQRARNEVLALVSR